MDSQKRSILVVEDDVQTREMYANVFRSADYVVLEAKDGLEGLDVALEKNPDVVFTGIVMPRMDGFTMIESLKKNTATSSIPVVMNSHLGREEDEKRANEMGVRDFIIRDVVPPREVVERIGRLFVGSEFEVKFDPYALDAQQLLRALKLTSFFTCSDQEQMVLNLTVVDPKNKLFEARMVCAKPRKKESE